MLQGIPSYAHMATSHYLDSPLSPTFQHPSNMFLNHREVNNRNMMYPTQSFASANQYATESVESTSPKSSSLQDGKREIIVFVQQQQGYSICYPNWWSQTEPFTGQILFVSPRTNPTQFCENISVVVEDLESKPFDLQEYTKITMKELTKEPYCKVFHSAGIS